MIWTPWSLPGLIAGGVAISLAVVVWRTGHGTLVSRALASLLFSEGVFIGGATGVLFTLPDPAQARATSVIAVSVGFASPSLYLILFGAALDTPLVRPFRNRWTVRALWATALACPITVLVRPDKFVSAPYHPTWAASNFQMVDWGVGMLLFAAAMCLFGLVSSLHALKVSEPGTASRSHALWLFLAFGCRDGYVTVAYGLHDQLRPLPFWGDFIYNPLQAVTYLLCFSLLGYGVLRTQLFDLDLRLKWALVRSGMLALIAVGFFVGSELLETVIPVQGVVLGLITAGIVVTALKPLQAGLERLLDTLMPGVEDSQEYLGGRKADVYAAAFEAGIRDGEITHRERSVLRTFAESLGLSDQEITKVEATVAARLGA